MKRVILFIAAFVTAVCAFAQEQGKAVIEFKKTVHNFGTFPEENGRVSCTFVFVNKGTEDLVLSKVRASCGCTTPDWTKTPVAPGDSGVVNATYNATGRPGAFTKTITVTTQNAGEHRLTIKGEVIPKAKKIEDEYPFSVGDLRLKNQNIYLHKIKNPESKSEKLMVYNNGSADITPTFKNVPSYITVSCDKEVIKPKSQAEITVVYDSKKSEEWGTVVSNFAIVANGESKTINVNVTVVEDFSKLTEEQKKNAPVISVGSVVPVNEIAKGSKKSFLFKIENKGKDPLIIRNITALDDNVVITKPKKPIKSGKSGDVSITIDAKNMKVGDFTKRLTIISNDPNTSRKVVSVSGTVK